MTRDEYLRVLGAVEEQYSRGRSMRVSHSGSDGTGDYFVDVRHLGAGAVVRLRSYATWLSELDHFYKSQGGDVRRRLGIADLAKLAAAIVGVFFFLGLSLGSTMTMPKHAIVYLDMAHASYLAPSCVTDPSGYELGTADEAYSLSFKPDDGCRNKGGFVQEGRSLSGKLLQNLGILKPLPHRWNPDGTWNW